MCIRDSISVSTPISIKRAAKICQQQGLVDFFLDACVFDFLATGGDRNFSLAAVHALRDYRRLSRNAAKQLHNRTTVHDTSDMRSCATADALTVLFYLVTLLLLPFTGTMRILHCTFSYAVHTV